MTDYIPSLIGAAALLYGGIIDFKRREIPNAVPIILIGVGVLFGFSTLWSIMELAATAGLLAAASKLTRSELPGGDFKLLCSLSFLCGLRGLAVILLFAGLGVLTVGIIRRLPFNRHIPLCSYVAPAYIAYHVIALMALK